MAAESDEFPWPKPRDILFRPDDDPQSDAWLNWALRGWDAYASGYLAAANLLVETVLETGQRTDMLIYPVAFLYRPYLELRLKEIIVQGQELLARQSDFKPVHQLDVLWNSLQMTKTELQTALDEATQTDSSPFRSLGTGKGSKAR